MSRGEHDLPYFSDPGTDWQGNAVEESTRRKCRECGDDITLDEWICDTCFWNRCAEQGPQMYDLLKRMLNPNIPQGAWILADAENIVAEIKRPSEEEE
jgi:hypothetical protein